MSSDIIGKYFEATLHRQVRDDLLFAAGIVGDTRITIDCGCGAGAALAFLISQGFMGHGFDSAKLTFNRASTPDRTRD